MKEEDLPRGVAPTDIDELNHWVVETVEARWNLPPIEREPNLFAMRFSAIEVLIKTGFDPTGIEISSQLVGDITDLESAHHNAGVLS